MVVCLGCPALTVLDTSWSCILTRAQTTSGVSPFFRNEQPAVMHIAMSALTCDPGGPSAEPGAASWPHASNAWKRRVRLPCVNSDGPVVMYIVRDAPSVRRALPPVGVQSTAEQLLQTTTVWLWLKTVVLRTESAQRQGTAAHLRQPATTRAAHGMLACTMGPIRAMHRERYNDTAWMHELSFVLVLKRDIYSIWAQ